MCGMLGYQLCLEHRAPPISDDSLHLAVVRGPADRSDGPPYSGLDQLLRIELQRDTIDAVAKPGRVRAVWEDVAKMRVTTAADDLGPFAKQRVVRLFVDRRTVQRFPERRPSGAGIKLVRGIKQLRIAAHASKQSGLFREVVMRERALRGRLPGDAVGLVRKLFAPFPVSFLYFVTH